MILAMLTRHFYRTVAFSLGDWSVCPPAFSEPMHSLRSTLAILDVIWKRYTCDLKHILITFGASA
jgi:hypothetical protein